MKLEKLVIRTIALPAILFAAVVIGTKCNKEKNTEPPKQTIPQENHENQ